MNLKCNALINRIISAHLFLIRLLAKREMMFSFSHQIAFQKRNDVFFFSSAIVVDECLMNTYLSVRQYITSLIHHFIKIIR